MNRMWCNFIADRSMLNWLRYCHLKMLMRNLNDDSNVNDLNYMMIKHPMAILAIHYC